MNKIPVFCFSHAGGMSFAYRDFVKLNQIGKCEYIPIDTSGHGKRMGDRLYVIFNDIVEDLYDKVCQKLDKYPRFVLLGHSMGAWIAYEIALRLHIEKHVSPLLLVLSSNVPTYGYNDRVTIDAGDEVLQQQLTERNPDLGQYFTDEILRNTFYPIIKADYLAIDNYLNTAGSGIKLECNILGLLADGDRFDGTIMKKWSEVTSGVYCQKILQGNHFALYKNYEYVNQLIEDCVS